LSLLEGSFAKETYDFIDPTHQSHPIFERDIKAKMMHDSMTGDGPKKERESD